MTASMVGNVQFLQVGIAIPAIPAHLPHLHIVHAALTALDDKHSQEAAQLCHVLRLAQHFTSRHLCRIADRN